MGRVLEPEIMADEIEAEAYDRLVSDEQGEMLDTCWGQEQSPSHFHRSRISSILFLSR